MKPYKNLYRSIYDFETLYQAFLCASSKKRYRDDVLKFMSNLEENLINIQNDLIHRTYRVGRYREFYVNEPKRRLIMALPVRDRVVQWAIYLILYPIFSKGFISDSYGSIEGRGPHAAAARAHKWMCAMEANHDKSYYLKMDIAKFFYRVDHDVLMNILQRKIADDGLLWLLGTIINSEDTAFGLSLVDNPGPGDRSFECGMPTGNLLSQLLANIYLNELDQFIKRKLKIKHYVRYMDDMVIFSDSKLLLHEYKKIINLFLRDELKLCLNNRTAIRPITLGLDFCGYRTWTTHRRLRKSTALRLKRRLKGLQTQYARGEVELDRALSVVHSYQGVLKHCNSYHLRSGIFGDPATGATGWFYLQRNTEETATE